MVSIASVTFQILTTMLVMESGSSSNEMVGFFFFPGCIFCNFFFHAPGYTDRGLKGGSTVLEKSREQRSGTFTPNKRDPSEFITVPKAGATRLNIKATEPSHRKRRGFHKESCRVLPSPACSTAQGWQTAAQSTAGPRRQTLAKGIA